MARMADFLFRIVGIDSAPSEFPPQTGTGTDVVWATPAFYRAHESGLDMSPGVALRLRHGAADLPAVQREVSKLAGGKFVQAYPLAAQALNTEHSIHLQAVALWLVAALLAVTRGLLAGPERYVSRPDKGGFSHIMNAMEYTAADIFVPALTRGMTSAENDDWPSAGYGGQASDQGRSTVTGY